MTSFTKFIAIISDFFKFPFYSFNKVPPFVILFTIAVFKGKFATSEASRLSAYRSYQFRSCFASVSFTQTFRRGSEQTWQATRFRFSLSPLSPSSEYTQATGTVVHVGCANRASFFHIESRF